MKAKSQERAETAMFSALEAAFERKALNPLMLDVRKLTLLTDYFLIASGQTPTHVRAIASAIEAQLHELGWSPTTIEGKQEGRWVLLDYGEFIIHVLRDHERGFYNLEQFWHKAGVIKRENWAQEIVNR